jgi:predicted NAD-dependent protein-ADP-ribosyltransferase YbiA (DUF1768 family)
MFIHIQADTFMCFFPPTGEHMMEFVQGNGINLKKRRLLISAMAAKDILLSTPLLQWYLQKGLIVTKIDQVVEFVPSKPFVSFVNDITHHRQMADKIPSKKIIALNKKLTGNSSYGSLILDKQKYTKTKNIKGLTNAKMAINQNNFKSLTELGGDYYQLDTVPSRIRMDLPLYLGVWILLYAKLRMLQFVWDFMDVFLISNKWVIGQMDTDSIYFSISELTLTDAVKPELRAQFQRMISHQCTSLKTNTCYIARDCCDEHAWLDSRTPDLFKLEWSGERLISLNSKTYCGKDQKGTIKLSCKGMNAATVKQNDPIKKYSNVLESRVSDSGINRGFRVDGQGVRTYSQIRQAFSYIYLKRQLKANGIHSNSLSVVLNPVPVKYFCLQDEAAVLGPDYKYAFQSFGRHFNSIRQAYAFMSIIHCTSIIQDVELQNKVTTTTEPRQLMTLTTAYRNSAVWCGMKRNILLQIVLDRTRQIHNAQELLKRSGCKIIVNACGFDAWSGVKYNARTLRWITDGYLCGQNVLGEFYKGMRDGEI